jgi:NDP-sugar pyrophosphorylase family protein
MSNSRKGQGQLAALILAAGQGTRMESSIPKVLHHVGGRPMLYYILRIANALKPGAIGVVVGHESDAVKAKTLEMAKSVGFTRPIQFIVQKKPIGSGNAVLESLPFLRKFKTAINKNPTHVLTIPVHQLIMPEMHGGCNILNRHKFSKFKYHLKILLYHV